MIERNDREQRVPPDEGGRVMAELLWKYVDELKQAENPEDVQFVAVTRGECAEVVGLMETAAEAYVLARTDSAPHCRREAVRRRLQAAMDVAAPAPEAAPRRSVRLPPWLTSPLTGRSTGWVVAVLALAGLVWFALPRPALPGPAPVVPMPHAEALEAIPRLVDGTLDADASRALWAHMLACDGCMRLYEKSKAAYRRDHPSRQSRLPAEIGAEQAEWRVSVRPANVMRISPPRDLDRTALFVP